VEQFQRALVTFLVEEENSHSGIARAGEPEAVFDVDPTRGDQDGGVRTVDHVQDQDQDREVRTVEHLQDQDQHRIQDQNQDQDTEVRTVDDVSDQAQRSQRTVTFS